MHFWIDKRSQGCGFRGRPLVPPSISGYGRNQRNLCVGFHPKPMVTPIHRFQSIESVANNGLRHHARSTPGYHSRVPSNNFQTCSVHHTTSAPMMTKVVLEKMNHILDGNYLLFASPSTSNVRNSQQNVGRSVEMISTTTPRRDNRPTAKLKCGVWVFFASVSFVLAGAKFYFHGVNIGMEGLAFCSLLVIILIIGGLLSLYEAITATASASLPHQMDGLPSSVLEQTDEDSQSSLSHHHQPLQNQHSHSSQNQVPITSHHHHLPPHAAELPPPPYHIAIMLPSQDDIATTESVQVIRDSPPPSYEKAVT